MKNLVFLLVILSLFFGCEKKLSNSEKANIDREVHENIRNIFKEVALDTTGIANSPVKVLTAKFVKREYSNYRDVRLTYKNVSNKTIEAIRFEWYGENAFGELADKERGQGFTEEKLKPNKTSSGVWKALSKDGKNIILAKAYEVVFSDGTKWKLKTN